MKTEAHSHIKLRDIEQTTSPEVIAGQSPSKTKKKIVFHTERKPFRLNFKNENKLLLKLEPPSFK